MNVVSAAATNRRLRVPGPLVALSRVPGPLVALSLLTTAPTTASLAQCCGDANASDPVSGNL